MRSPRALPAQRGVGQQAHPSRTTALAGRAKRTPAHGDGRQHGGLPACHGTWRPAQGRAQTARVGARQQEEPEGPECHQAQKHCPSPAAGGVRHTGGGEKQNWKTLSLPREVKTALKITTRNSVAWGLLRESWSLPLLVVLGKVLGFYVHGKLLFGGVGAQHDGL